MSTLQGKLVDREAEIAYQKKLFEFLRVHKPKLKLTQAQPMNKLEKQNAAALAKNPNQRQQQLDVLRK